MNRDKFDEALNGRLLIEHTDTHDRVSCEFSSVGLQYAFTKMIEEGAGDLVDAIIEAAQEGKKTHKSIIENRENDMEETFRDFGDLEDSLQKSIRKYFLEETEYEKTKEFEGILNSISKSVDLDHRGIEHIKLVAIGMLKSQGLNIPNSLNDATNGQQFKKGLLDIKDQMQKTHDEIKPLLKKFLVSVINKKPNLFMKCQHIMIEMFADKDLPTPMVLQDAVTGDELFEAMEETKHLLLRS